MIHRFFLTFDSEDFINPNGIFALRTTLELLQKHKLKGIFFITAHMAERLTSHDETLDLLRNHEIGYHSSGHSVHPLIAEFTDVDNYRKAYFASLERETSHVNPLTGKIEGEGGLLFVKDLFHPKKIEAFRAPGMSWTTPHLEALANLGIKYDFSSSISVSEIHNYRGITFYPYTFIQHWEGTKDDYKSLFSAVLKRKTAVFDLHPAMFVNNLMWDSIYYKGNPKSLLRVPQRPIREIAMLFSRFEMLLKQINILRRSKLIETDPYLQAQSKRLTMNETKVQKCFEESISWPKKYFGYNPRYLRSHFFEFFQGLSE